jgi:hypothetical protein|tara:strand:+ start:5197 stop:5577 length:381 start_codon:yes stop_codon:yes gene_type:complete
MTRGDRVKALTFLAAELTSDSSGNLDVYRKMNGEIKKIEYTDDDFAANGSIAVAVSGTGELFWIYKNAVANQQDYIHVYSVDSARATGSPHLLTHPMLGAANDTIHVWTSGVGNGTSAVSLSISYV